MRLLISIVMIALLFGVVVFAATNLGTTVPIRLFTTVYEQVHIAYVVVLSVLAGALIVGLFAVFEGAKIRLENRRLRREIGRLDSQLTFMRSQPTAAQRAEPDDLTNASPALAETENDRRPARTEAGGGDPGRTPG